MNSPSRNLPHFTPSDGDCSFGNLGSAQRRKNFPTCTCPAGICPLHLWLSTLKSSPQVSILLRRGGPGRQVIDPSAFPAKGAGLGKAQMSQHAKSEFARHLI